jgi:lipid A 4'-phosphatase
MKPVLFIAAAAAAALFFWMFPQVDLAVTGFFWRAEDGFYLRDFFPFWLLRRSTSYITASIVVATLLWGAWAWRRGRSIRPAIFLIATLALGPGIVVNTVLKDNWGRARPAQVTEFGGTKQFTPAPLIADQCPRNCSFVAGDPAIGFWFLALAFLTPARHRLLAAAGATLFGAVIGLARIAQGGHFLSDVIFSGFAVAATVWLLYWLLIERRRFSSSSRGSGNDDQVTTRGRSRGSL